MKKIEPRNLTAQLHYRGRGNPPNAQPVSAISNCFPGLEFDFRAAWRRMLVGIVLSENNNYVVACEDSRFESLVGCRLVRLDGLPTGVKTTGTMLPGFPPGDLQPGSNRQGVSFMEWSNSFVRVRAKQGGTVQCIFTAQPSDDEVLPSDEDIKDGSKYRTVELQLRPFFEQSEVNGETQVAIARELVRPGELTQGLCSPWQNDYRECACYYWAASRPDYVNVQTTETGETRGDNWLAKSDKTGTGRYVLDDRADNRLVSYDDLFRDWQGELRFVVGGSDAADKKDREP
jgi:hypothetical protein